MRATILSAELSRREFFELIARTVMQSRVSKFFAALALWVLGIGVAYWCWQVREVVGGVVAVVVGYVALRLGWERLPFSAETRARWAWEAELEERYPSYRLRKWIYVGLGLLISAIGQNPGWPPRFQWWQLSVPLAMVAIGTVATVIWHTCHSKHHSFEYHGSERSTDESQLS